MSNSSQVDELNKSLKGVTPLSDIVITQKGHKSYRFKTPYGNKKLSSLMYSRCLKSMYGKSPLELILDINQMSLDDLPRCRICKINPVSFFSGRSDTSRIDLLNPQVLNCCSDRKCSVKNARHTQLNNGGHVSQLLSADELSDLASRANRTKVKNGNHVSQTHGHIYRTIRGVEYHFSSNAEHYVFNRFFRFLSKHYSREKFVVEYMEGRNYSCDYLIKPTYTESIIRGIKLPDVIEVKSMNLFFCKYHGSKIKNINYMKFRAVIDSGKTILVIDKQERGLKYHFLKNTDDLDSLFGRSM